MMHNSWKRLLSGLLALVLVVGMLPTAAWAQADVTEPEQPELTETLPSTQPEESQKAPLPSTLPQPSEEESLPTEAVTAPTTEETVADVLPTETVAVETLSAEETQAAVALSEEDGLVASGDCGENLTWTLDQEGLLTISGSGDMINMSYGTAPWSDYQSQILSVVVEPGVTSIGAYAFYSLYALASITLPEGLVSIGDYAFYFCMKLAGIHIPATVTGIGSSVFAYTTSLTEISVAEGNRAYTCVDGILYTKDMTTLLLAPADISGTVTIPEGVTSIAIGGVPPYPDSIVVESGNAAYRCVDNCLIEIASKTLLLGYGNCIIPADGSVAHIAEKAFYSSKLTSIVIPEGVTTIGSSAFSYSSRLTTITLPVSLATIEYSAFNGASNLTTVRYAGTQAQWNAISIHSGNTALTNADIHFLGEEASTTIASGTYGTQVSWALKEGGTLTISGAGKIADYSAASDVPYASYRDQITTVVVEPGVTAIGDHALCSLSNLTSVSLPEGLTAIGFESFRDCVSLTDVTIPEGVTTISAYAFAGCTGMTQFTVPASVAMIGTAALPAFLTELTVASGNKTFHASGNCLIFTAAKTLVAGFANSVIPADGSVTEIGGYAFLDCTGLTTLTIPEGVTTIGSSAFFSCPNLESIVLPLSLTSIGDRAFTNCLSLKLVGYAGTQAQWEKIAIGTGNTRLTDASIRYDGSDIENPNIVGSGTFGKDLTWTLDDHGTLTITGTGAMGASAPWPAHTTNITKVVISQGVTTIGDFAFSNCENLQEISIADSVTSIGDYAFVGCGKLAAISLPEGITTIGSYVFSGCMSLTSITIPASVTSLGYCSFMNCKKLEAFHVAPGSTSFYADSKGVLYNYRKTTLIAAPASLSGHYVIPDTVTTISNWAFHGLLQLTGVTLPAKLRVIGDQAFHSCALLGEVTIPATVTSIGESAFSCCYFLSSITVAGGNSFYADSKGVLYTRDMTRLISAPGMLSGSYEIPQGVTTMDRYAFEGCPYFTALTIPGTMSTLSYGAFSNYSSLAQVTVREGVTSVADRAFVHCSSLRTITLPSTLTAIGASAFQNCSSLTDVAFNGTAAQWGAISIAGGNSSLTNANVQFAVLFSGECGPSTVWKLLSDGTLVICGTGSMTQYPSGTAPWYAYREHITAVEVQEGVTELCDYALAECSKVTRISLPSTLSFFGTQVLYRCDSLTSITVAEGNPTYHSAGNCLIKTISRTLLAGCSASQIPADGSITTIEDYAFAHCRTLTGITLPEGITAIGSYAFYGTGLTTVTIPGSTTHLGEAAFSSCPNLARIAVASGSDSFVSDPQGVLYHQDATTLICAPGALAGDYTIPSTVTCIEPKAFQGCVALTKVTIPGSVATMGQEAFSGCSALAEVDVKAGVTNLSDRAFASCVALTKITLPLSLCSVGNGTFQGDTALANVDYEGNQQEWAAISIGSNNECLTSAAIRYEYNVLAQGICTDSVRWMLSNDGILTISGTGIIPSYAKGQAPWYSYRSRISSVSIRHGITSIGKYAFYGCSLMTSVAIPTGVTAINDYAFYDCRSLEELQAPETITRITSSAVAYCTSLAHVSLPDGLTSIGRQAFYGCGITSITLPDSITTIDEAAFTGCGNLVSISIPQHVTVIADEAFSHCGSLSHISIPDSVTSIGDSAFFACLSLSRITLPQGLTEIGSEAFGDCRHLKEIALPSGVTTIGDGAFSLCHELTTITIPAGVTSIGDGAFANCSKLRHVYFVGTQAQWDAIAIGANNSYLTDANLLCGIYISTSTDSLSLTSGNSMTLSLRSFATGKPISATWSLDAANAKYAQITPSGRLTARSVSDLQPVTVQALPTAGGNPVYVEITIIPPAAALNILLYDQYTPGGRSWDMSQGTTLPLTIHQDPYTVANSPVSWTSSNSAVATVDQNGLVTIRKPGTTNITATAQDINRISNTLPLTIYYVDTANKLTATVDAPDIGLQPGQTAAMTVRGDGEISSSYLSFTSSNPEIVTVEDGILTAGETTGTATITATLVGDPLNRKVSVKVKVIPLQAAEVVLVLNSAP